MVGDRRELMRARDRARIEGSSSDSTPTTAEGINYVRHGVPLSRQREQPGSLLAISLGGGDGIRPSPPDRLSRRRRDDVEVVDDVDKFTPRFLASRLEARSMDLNNDATRNTWQALEDGQALMNCREVASAFLLASRPMTMADLIDELTLTFQTWHNNGNALFHRKVLSALIRISGL